MLLRLALVRCGPNTSRRGWNGSEPAFIAGDRDRAATALQHVRAAIDVADRERRAR